MAVELKPHNKQAYEQVKNILKKTNRAAVIHPTGTGKSYIALKLIEENPEKKIIYLSPSTSIMHQLKRDMLQEGVDFRNLERYTYQKLTAINRKDEINLDADIIILDEFHHCGAPEWGKAVQELIKRNPKAQILGLSATPMRYFDGEIRDMAEELFDSNIASEITLEEAIATGILREPDYATGIYETEEIIKEQEEIIQKCPSAEKRRLAYEKLQELKTMLEGAVKGLPELLANKMTNKSGKYIVYCRNIEDMQKKVEQAQDIFGRVNTEIEIMSISSNNSEHENESTVKKFEKNHNSNTLKLLFSVDMLNEGYHLRDLDGVIMMRPTHSPTLYYQQLGRALSVGIEKQPIVIDLVNNIDTIEIIESFSKSLGQAKARNTKAKNSKASSRNFAMSEETKKIKAIVNKIDSLVKRNVQSKLSNKEKLDLMTEYMRETGEAITIDTQYKGYNIGHLRNNLRQQYYRGTLHIDEELLNEFLKNGIIVEEKERIRTSTQEKYEFLMSLNGQSKEELEKATMENGLSYVSVKRQIQTSYNADKLNLTPEQIRNLRANGHLDFSKKEKEEIANRYNLPKKYAVDIERKIGSYEEFIEKYKKGKFNYKFKNDVFVGYRGITVSEKDITEMQKLNYANLALSSICENVQSLPIEEDFERYIDIDGMIQAMRTLTEREREILELTFGLKDGNIHTLKDVAQEFNITEERVRQIREKAIRKLRIPARKKLIFGNIKTLESEKENLDTEYSDKQAYKKGYEIIKAYITNPDGTIKLKKEIIDIKLSELGIQNEVLSNITDNKDLTIHELISSNAKGTTLLSIPIEELELTVRAYNVLDRNGVKDILDLTRYSLNDLAKMRNMGRKSLDEVLEKLDSLGLKLRDENEDKEGITYVISEQYRQSTYEEAKKETYAKHNYAKQVIDFNIPIEELELTGRTYNVLRRAGVKDILDLTKYSLNDLEKMRNLGRKSLDEVVEKLASLGLRLRNENENKEDMTYVISEQDRQITYEEAKKAADINKLLNYCNTSIEAYSRRLREIEDKENYISEKIIKYKEAYKNYIENEDIFNPDAIVPGVSIKQSEVEGQTIDEMKKTMKQAVYDNVATNQETRGELHQLTKRLEQSENVK